MTHQQPAPRFVPSMAMYKCSLMQTVLETACTEKLSHLKRQSKSSPHLSFVVVCMFCLSFAACSSKGGKSMVVSCCQASVLLWLQFAWPVSVQRLQCHKQYRMMKTCLGCRLALFWVRGGAQFLRSGGILGPASECCSLATCHRLLCKLILMLRLSR